MLLDCKPALMPAIPARSKSGRPCERPSDRRSRRACATASPASPSPSRTPASRSKSARLLDCAFFQRLSLNCLFGRASSRAQASPEISGNQGLAKTLALPRTVGWVTGGRRHWRQTKMEMLASKTLQAIKPAVRRKDGDLHRIPHPCGCCADGGPGIAGQGGASLQHPPCGGRRPGDEHGAGRTARDAQPRRGAACASRKNLALSVFGSVTLIMSGLV